MNNININIILNAISINAYISPEKTFWAIEGLTRALRYIRDGIKGFHSADLPKGWEVALKLSAICANHDIFRCHEHGHQVWYYPYLNEALESLMALNWSSDQLRYMTAGDGKSYAISGLKEATNPFASKEAIRDFCRGDRGLYYKLLAAAGL